MDPVDDARKEQAINRYANRGNGSGQTEPGTWPPAIDLERLSETEPEPPKFVIPDWLPAGYATLFAGHGGVGKSALGLHLSVCIAAGMPFFGLQVGRRRVLYLSCEDREAILHWRLARICAHLKINLGSLRGWLEIIDLVGVDVILWEKSAGSPNALTLAYGILDERMRLGKPEVLIVDGISDTYGGGESTRGEVKRFVNSMVALIPPDTGAVILIGHVSKPTAANRNGEATTSEGYSGSTSWHNSCRARWYLYPDKADDDGGKSGDLTLELQKSNLGRTDQSIKFAWSEEQNLFLAKDTTDLSAFDRRHRDQTEQDAVLAALRACCRGNPPTIVPAATTGRRTAFHVLQVRPEFPNSLRSAGNAGVRRFWRQIEVLRAMGDVNAVSYQLPDRHKVMVLSVE